ncbi:cysteine proteinase [Lojkania enalia]|uniref:Cysteine proteinase n=1 Tax=Lojkania enalia TaxID=147567 RepID=A0A9P4JZH9_9PLEO|nr:cysteine proteinase [Didymosphaeria enalia]
MSAYSPEQVSAFVEYIGLPAKYHVENNPQHGLEFLTALHIHTISAVPYENLSLHYSPTHTISIDPHDAFQKVVGNRRGRGGYCMEVGIFFNHILRGLGFKAYTVGVRIRLREAGAPAGNYIGWVHIVNIVTLPSGAKYMLDVGFGGDGATKPLPLLSGHSTHNLGNQEIRLIYDHIPTQTHRTEASKLWIYQYRNGPHLPWNSFYAFPELEFLESDFRIMNWYTGSHPESFQVFTLLVIKFLKREKEGAKNGEQEVYGKRMLVNGTVKENLGGRTRVVQECATEEERVRALEGLFGIILTGEEREGIMGHPTELKGTSRGG